MLSWRRNTFDRIASGLSDREPYVAAQACTWDVEGVVRPSIQ